MRGIEVTVPQVVRSEAWLLMGLSGSLAGVLELRDGRLSFTTVSSGAAGMPLLLGMQLRSLERKAQAPGLAERLSFRASLKEGEPVRVFDAPIQEVGEADFPWYYFGRGAVFTVRDARFRFSFIKPQNARMPGTGAYVAGALDDLLKGGGAAEAWKAALGARH
jgi:hypothetical protein